MFNTLLRMPETIYGTAIATLIDSINNGTNEWQKSVQIINTLFGNTVGGDSKEMDYLSTEVVYSVTKLFSHNTSASMSSQELMVKIIFDIINIPGNEINTDIDVIHEMVDQCKILIQLSSNNFGENFQFEEIFNQWKVMPYSILTLALARHLLNCYMILDVGEWDVSIVSYLTTKLTEIPDEITQSVTRFMSIL